MHSHQPWGRQGHRWGHGCQWSACSKSARHLILVCPLHSGLLCKSALEDFRVNRSSRGRAGPAVSAKPCGQLRSRAFLLFSRCCLGQASKTHRPDAFRAHNPVSFLAALVQCSQQSYLLRINLNFRPQEGIFPLLPHELWILPALTVYPGPWGIKQSPYCLSTLGP